MSDKAYLHVDVHGEIPDIFGGFGSVGVLGVHYSGVVEDYVDATPGVNVGDHGCNVGFFGDVASDGF